MHQQGHIAGSRSVPFQAPFPADDLAMVFITTHNSAGLRLVFGNRMVLFIVTRNIYKLCTTGGCLIHCTRKSF
jgi:hypothetical protein